LPNIGPFLLKEKALLIYIVKSELYPKRQSLTIARFVSKFILFLPLKTTQATNIGEFSMLRESWAFVEIDQRKLCKMC
jgi:hypothetical protein